jgi:hypothetical protein
MHLDVGPQMVVPSFSALLPYSSMQDLGYARPFPQPELFH